MAKNQTRERNHDRGRSEWDDNGRDLERGQRVSDYDEGDDWRYRTSESNERRREGGWRPAEYGREEGEHFPWSGGEGPVRWSEGRRGRASEEDWRGGEQTYDERTHGPRRGASEPHGRYGQGQYGWQGGQGSYGSRGQQESRGGYREEQPYGSRGGYGQGSYGSQGQQRWQGGSYGQGQYGSQGQQGWQGGGSGQGQYGWQGTGQGRWGSEGYFDSGSRHQGQGSRMGQVTSHYGRGPKGYRRSDERIREDVNEALYKDHDIDASDIDVQVHEGEVTLSGSVDSREVKRAAEDCVWSVSGVRNVTTMLKVSDEQGSSSDKDGGKAESSSNRNKNKTATAGASGS